MKIPKKWEVWITISHLSDKFLDCTERVTIINIEEIWNYKIVRYRPIVSFFTHTILFIITNIALYNGIVSRASFA